MFRLIRSFTERLLCGRTFSFLIYCTPFRPKEDDSFLGQHKILRKSNFILCVKTIFNHLHQTQTHFLVYVTSKSSFTPTIYTKFKIYTIFQFLSHKSFAVTPYLVLFYKKTKNEFEFEVWLKKISTPKLIFRVCLEMV